MGFAVSGMDAVIQQFSKMGQKADDAFKQAVKAGGQHVANALKENAPYRDGDLQKSIKPDPVKYSAAEGYHCDVGPKGDDPETGESLAKIGNILEYGRENMPPRPWFHPTVAAVEKDTVQVMAKALDVLEE